MNTVMAVFGTRPEAIKMSPVLKRFSESADKFELVTVISSQHKDLLTPFIKLLAITVDYDLDVMAAEQTPVSVLSRTMDRLSKTFEMSHPNIVLVQGDTSTALGAALAAFHEKIPVAHIEAGLRSGNTMSPFPEEMNRRLISRLATLNFAATEQNRELLLREGIDSASIYVTGNPVVDALQFIRRSTTISEKVAHLLRPWRDHKIVLLTTHRRESFGEIMSRNLKELSEFIQHHADLVLVFPVHPNPKVREAVATSLRSHDRIVLIDPLNYTDFIHVLERAWLIVSDSGGVQEEAPSLGRPLLVLRENTERPEGLSTGMSKLVGGDPARLRRMLAEAYEPNSWVHHPTVVPNPFGNGNASQKIYEAISQYFARSA